MNRTTKMLVAGVAGMGAGVLAALLVAPLSGREARHELRESAKDVGTAAQRRLLRGRLRVTELVSASSDLARQVRDRAAQLATSTRQSPAEEAVESAGSAQQQAQHEASDILAQAADMLGKAKTALEAFRQGHA
ncbi:MAG: YtxH domain-containing protein [Cyanobacteria bacterium REEB65]|nr:YtxH domain-containing protein [Cyanobacteria bacterium REEB65]